MMFKLDLIAAPAFLIDVGSGSFRFRSINAARATATGCLVRDVSGRSPQELFAPSVAEHLVQQFTQCVSRQHALEFEEEIALPEGRRTLLTTLSPLLSRDGKTVRQLLGVGIDITERKRSVIDAEEQAQRAEREARDAHSRLRDAIESLPEAIMFLDSEDRYVLWNRKYAELYADIADLLAPGARFIDVLRASIDRGNDARGHGRRRRTGCVAGCIGFAIREFRKEEEYSGGRWMRHEERRTTDGGTIGVRVDITDLKAREQSFRLLFSNNPVPMYVFDVELLLFLDVNDAAIASYGYTREQFLGMSVLEIRPESERARARHHGPGANLARYAVGNMAASGRQGPPASTSKSSLRSCTMRVKPRSW